MNRVFFFVLVFVSAVVEAQTKKFDWSSTLAAKSLGLDFISPSDVMNITPDMKYTASQLEELAKSIPSSRIDVWWLKNANYILMPLPPEPMSLSDVRGVRQDSTHGEKTSSGWLAIKKEAIPKSLGHPWREQVKLLSSNERVPNSAELVWYVNTYFKIRGVRLFQKLFVRTSSVDENKNRTVVGFFTDDDPKVCVCVNDAADPVVGISAAGVQKKK